MKMSIIIIYKSRAVAERQLLLIYLNYNIRLHEVLQLFLTPIPAAPLRPLR